MNYGLYLSASGVLTNSYRQDVLANNLANVNTVGFKPDLPTVAQRPAEADEDLTPFGTSHELLDRLGGGVLAGPQRTSFAAGPIEQTGRPLDVAFTDQTSFLAVEETDAQTGETAVRLTRDGRLAINGQGFLVNTTGQRILGPGDQPIALSPSAQTTVLPDGTIQQDGADVATLQIATVNNTAALTKTGGNLFAFSGDDPRTPNLTPSLRPGALESSGTNGMATMLQILGVTRAANSNARLIEVHDTLMDRAINTLGRVS